MIAIAISVAVICALVVIDFWLPRRAFSRPKAPPVTEPEVNADQLVPDPSIPADAIAPIHGVVHHSRFNLPQSFAPQSTFSRAATSDSPSFCRKHRFSVSRAFVLHSGHRRPSSHRSGPRRRRTTE